ncbi:MAG: hypothetical protein AAF560_06325 [Acidobacteriota bacterium]
MLRLEQVLLAAFSAAWLLAILIGIGLVPLAGTLDLDLYRLYSIAAVLGWVAGNIYVFRSQAVSEARWRKVLLWTYLIGPPSFVYIIRSLAREAVQQAAPLVPIYSFAIYALFFLVPVTLRATRQPRKGLGDR